MSTIKKAIITLSVTLALLAMGLYSLLSMAIDSQPNVSTPGAVDYQTVASSKALLKRLLQQLESASSSTTLAIDELELKNLARMGSHSFRELTADISIEGERMQPAASLQLPTTPFGNFLNISFQVPSSDSRLTFQKLQIGSLSLPGSWLLPATTLLANAILPQEQLTSMLDVVSSIRIQEKTAFVTLKPPSGGLKSDIKQTVRRLQALRFPPGEQDRALHYYDLLTNSATRANFDPYSLSYFLQPLMAEASRQSTDSSAVAENRAVIWAMAIYFSYGEFEKLVGDLVSEKRRLVYPAFNVTLQGRRDLMQHFVYSAAISLATRQGIGIATGEFKELLDSGGPGSGFSFVDLAADRAGVHFASAAVASEKQAREIQQSFLEQGSEANYFPDIDGFEEGLTEEAFTARFTNTRSQAYQEQISRIDSRISKLPAYRARDN